MKHPLSKLYKLPSWLTNNAPYIPIHKWGKDLNISGMQIDLEISIGLNLIYWYLNLVVWGKYMFYINRDTTESNYGNRKLMMADQRRSHVWSFFSSQNSNNVVCDLCGRTEVLWPYRIWWRYAFFFFKRKALLVRGRQTLLSLAVHRETVPRTHIIQLHIMG